VPTWRLGRLVPVSRYSFDAEKANDICNFSATLRHVQDSITTRADTGRLRFSRCYSEMGRGNGKSFLSSGVVLYKSFADGTYGSQAICAASLRDQARIVLDTARQMVIKDEQLRKSLGLEVTAHTIIQPQTNSKLWALPARASTAEGLAINVGILDELHLQRGRSLYDTLSTGCTKKDDSLLFLVTTAGNDEAGIAYELHSFLERVLTRENEDESFFVAMYGIDPDDDWHNLSSWQKANPSWGVSISPRALEEEFQRAKQIPGARANFRIKHLSEWIANGGDVPFLDASAIKRCYDADLDESQFDGKPAVAAADLASRLDMCSYVRLHSRRIDKKINHYVFCKNWLPESQRDATVAYANWIERSELVITPGQVTDQDAIEEFIAGEMEKCTIRDFGFDPIQSSMLLAHLMKRGLAAVEIMQSAKILTPGVHELQDAVMGGRLHTNSQILIWALGNLRVRSVGSSMLQPCRPADRALKIDAAVALIMALCSISTLPLDESKRSPRIYFMDDNTGQIEVFEGGQ
jgi:phage terminase large subunit-like protein